MTFLARHQLRAIINRSTVARLLASFGHRQRTAFNDQRPPMNGKPVPADPPQ